MDDTNKTCREFVAALASSAPTPGGGGAAALCGAVGAALCGMVASLTTGKKKYASVEREIQQLLESTNTLHDKLLDQVRADAEGFQPLSRAYAIPREDPTRAAALQSAAETACTAPLEIMALCAAALSAAGRLAEIGSRLAVSDAGCAAAILHGALEAAALNVLVNTKTMTDRSAADHLNARCFALLDQGRTDGERIFCAVRDQLV